jgi:carbamoylphosphate synthase large subunit
MSKFSLPYLQHESVPKTQFLDRVEHIPDDLQNYVIKPLFSFAGLGVLINPTKADLAAIPPEKRSQFILQEKINFESLIETPLGLTKAEVRMMYIWIDELLPVMSIVRMGRGLMMGVDHNKNMEWVGSSAALYRQ